MNGLMKVCSLFQEKMHLTGASIHQWHCRLYKRNAEYVQKGKSSLTLCHSLVMKLCFSSNDTQWYEGYEAGDRTVYLLGGKQIGRKGLVVSLWQKGTWEGILDGL